MKVKALIKRLQELEKEHGNLEVLFNDPNHDSIWGIMKAHHEVVDGDCYPDDWGMPDGFEYIELGVL